MTKENPEMLNDPKVRKQLRDYKALAEMDDRNRQDHQIYSSISGGRYNPVALNYLSSSLTTNANIAMAESVVGEVVDATTTAVNSYFAEKDRQEDQRTAEYRQQQANAQAKQKAIKEWEDNLLEARKNFEKKTAKAIVDNGYTLVATIPDMEITYETEKFIKGDSYYKGNYVHFTAPSFKKETVVMKDWSSSKTYNLHVVELNGLYGILGDKGESIYPPQFKGIYVLEDIGQRARFLVNIEDKWGEIMADGSLSEEIKYDGIWYTPDKQSKILRQNDEWAIKDVKTNLQAKQFTTSQIPDLYAGGLIPVYNTLRQDFNDKGGSYSLAGDGKIYVWGETTEEGVIPISYESAKKGEITERLFKIDGHWFITANYGTEEMTTVSLPSKFVIPVLRAIGSEKKWGAIDQDGKVIIPFEHTFIKDTGIEFETDKGTYKHDGTFVPKAQLDIELANATRKYHNNGNLKSIGAYNAEGGATGTWKHYHENGKLSHTGEFKNGERIGIWHFYADDGITLINEVPFPDGISKTFYPNGRLKAQGVRIHGMKTGAWTFYVDDTQKTVYAQGNYVDDNQNGHWKYYHNNGQVDFEGEHINGAFSGEWRFYNENGNLIKKGILTGSRLAQGEWEFYFDNGKPQAIGSFEDDQKTGKWEFYHPNGKLKETGKYRKGEKIGRWHSYDENGNEL